MVRIDVNQIQMKSLARGSFGGCNCSEMLSRIQTLARSMIYRPYDMGLFPILAASQKEDCCFSSFQVGGRKDGQRIRCLPVQTLFFLIGKKKLVQKPHPSHLPQWSTGHNYATWASLDSRGLQSQVGLPITAAYHHHYHWSRKMNQVRRDMVRGIK